MQSPKRDYSFSNYGPLPFDENVLLLPFGRKSFLPALVQRFNGEPIDMGPNTDREAYHLRVRDRRVTLIYSGMGSPVTANALEKAAANGVKRVVLFGACGGVAPHVQAGDLVVPTAAIRGEGTSRYYLPASFPAIADTDLGYRLLQAAKAQSQTAVHSGVVYTTDASYRQGSEVYQDSGDAVIAVDCECSAAFIAASSLGLRIAALFFCTDNIRAPDRAGRSRQGLENERVRHSFELASDISIAVLTNDSATSD